MPCQRFNYVVEQYRHDRRVHGLVVAAWLTGAHVNEVNPRRARLVLRWVTVFWLSFRCGTIISVCYQPPRSTQPGHPFVYRRNEYQPKGGDVTPCGWGVKTGFVCGWQGATENAGVENARVAKMQGWKSQEWKSRHQTAGVENAGVTSMESQNSII